MTLKPSKFTGENYKNHLTAHTADSFFTNLLFKSFEKTPAFDRPRHGERRGLFAWHWRFQKSPTISPAVPIFFGLNPSSQMTAVSFAVRLVAIGGKPVDGDSKKPFERSGQKKLAKVFQNLKLTQKNENII